MAFICGGLKILKFCSGAQVQGIFRPRRSGFKGLNKFKYPTKRVARDFKSEFHKPV